MTVAEIVPNLDRKPTDPKLNRTRVHHKGRRWLFGTQVNEHGFLSDSGRVLKVNDEGQVCS